MGWSIWRDSAAYAAASLKADYVPPTSAQLNQRFRRIRGGFIEGKPKVSATYLQPRDSAAYAAASLKGGCGKACQRQPVRRFRRIRGGFIEGDFARAHVVCEIKRFRRIRGGFIEGINPL